MVRPCEPFRLLGEAEVLIAGLSAPRDRNHRKWLRDQARVWLARMKAYDASLGRPHDRDREDASAPDHEKVT